MFLVYESNHRTDQKVTAPVVMPCSIIILYLEREDSTNKIFFNCLCIAPEVPVLYSNLSSTRIRVSMIRDEYELWYR